MQLSIKAKDFFSHFFVIFQKLDEVLNIFEKKRRPIANVFPKLRTPKNAVRQMSKKCRYRVPFKNNMVNAPERSSNLNDGSFITFIDYCEKN